MEEKAIIKGKFKINKSTLVKRLILSVAFLCFAFLFLALVIKSGGNEDVLYLVGVSVGSFFAFALGIIPLIDTLLVGRYKIELYENEMKIKKSFSKEKTIRYDDITDSHMLLEDFAFSTDEKVYILHHLENALEISLFIKNKRMEIEKSKALKLDEEEKNYKSKKKKMLFRILVECFIFLLIFALIFVCVWLTDGKDISEFSSYENKIFFAFSAIEAVLLVSSLLYASVAAKAVRKCNTAKIRYSKALSTLYIDRELPENVVRVIRTFNGERFVVYQSSSGAYKCSYEIFVFKSKTWYSCMLSDSYQTLEEIEMYLDDFRDDFVD